MTKKAKYWHENMCGLVEKKRRSIKKKKMVIFDHLMLSTKELKNTLEKKYPIQQIVLVIWIATYKRIKLNTYRLHITHRNKPRWIKSLNLKPAMGK